MSQRDTVPRLLGYGVSAVRFAVSGMFAVQPGATMTRLYGDKASQSRYAGLAAGHFVLRDLLLGIGLLRALRSGRNARGWMLAGTLADVFDLGVIAALQPDRARRAQLLLGMTAIVSTDAVLTALLRDAPIPVGTDRG
ncbi:MAG TPA: hypothetical protein VG247_35105 [Pseudonocardiaceae bacterium]|jgi:hypothetical protein|nr:hypothetical protein [Pseudonocardiaceae bacterium]